MSEYNSTLSTKRIIISLALFFSTPFLAYALNLIVNNMTISYTFAINLVGFILIVYDWNLFGIHYNRAKYHMNDTILFIIVGTLFIGAWTWLNKSFIHGYIIMSDAETVKKYMFGIVPIILAFSLIHSFCISLAYKCLTDHLDIKQKEIQVILVSGFAFGLLYVIFFVPFNLFLWIRSYVYYIVLIMFLSYSYNQTTSFMPGAISLAIILAIFNILPML